MDEKWWKTWKSNQKMVMDEELVQNVVVDEKIVKNFVMGAKIDPKIEMDLRMFEIGGWIESWWMNFWRKQCYSLLEFQAEIHPS